MRIVNLKTFLEMPVGTVFQKYEPCVFSSFGIKAENVGNWDFYYQDLEQSILCSGSDEEFFILDESEKTGDSFRLDFDCMSRDGMFNDNQLFVVWEDGDVDYLRETLQNRKNI